MINILVPGSLKNVLLQCSQSVILLSDLRDTKSRGMNMKRSVVLLGVLLMLFSAFGSNAIAAESMSVVNTGEKKVELTSTLGVDHIKYFTLDAPKRLVVDLYGVVPGTHADTIPLMDGFEQLRTGPLAGKTRFVFDVTGNSFPVFKVDVRQEGAIVTWDATNMSSSTYPAVRGSATVSSIDFNAVDGKSALNIDVDGKSEASSVTRDDTNLTFSLKKTSIPKSLQREFDTLSFPSAIYSAYAYQVNVGGQPEVRFIVQLKDEVPYELSKTSNGYVLTVEDGKFADVQPVVSGTLPVGVNQDLDTIPDSVGAVNPSVPIIDNRIIEAAPPKAYTGEKTSLVFDNADVRDILRLIAEISELNIIAPDNVEGDITLRLVDVPWDQALDLILEVSGLGMLQDGNVIRVLPLEDIRKMKEEALASARSQEKLEPIETAVVTVSYADLKSVEDPAKKLLSDRGSVTLDNRNKLIIINDIRDRIDKIKDLIDILDTPERQVMIEARIVQVNSNYSRELGVHWGILTSQSGSNSALQTISSAGSDFLVDITEGAVGPLDAGAGWASQWQGTINNFTLDLQMKALESNGNGKVISTPRVTTLNGEKALISQGTTIPYQTVSGDGTETEFVDAVLKLEVTPVINPDSSIILDILATNDSPSLTSGASAPSIDTKKAQTKVLVRDGETTVIGGIYVESISDSADGIPGLMNIPVLGHFFKTSNKQTVKDELLIFVTPRIVSVD